MLTGHVLDPHQFARAAADVEQDRAAPVRIEQGRAAEHGQRSLGLAVDHLEADAGFGGDPITPHAVRVDLPTPYTFVGHYPVQLGGDCANLVWFRDGALDFVYSSHLLEDFIDTRAALAEWLRVLKPGGRLIIFCPDEQRFRAHCARTGQPYNTNHKHAHFSLDFVEGLLRELGNSRPVHRNPDVDIYSWDLVVEKLPAPGTAAPKS